MPVPTQGAVPPEAHKGLSEAQQAIASTYERVVLAKHLLRLLDPKEDPDFYVALFKFFVAQDDRTREARDRYARWRPYFPDDVL